jgi:hypothetical protein
VVSWGNTEWVTEQRPGGKAVLAIRFARYASSYRAEPVLPGELSRAALLAGMDAMAPPAPARLQRAAR